MEIIAQNAEDIKGLQKYILTLTKDEKVEVSRIIKQLPRLDVRQIDDKILTRVQMAGLNLPSRIVESLLQFKRNPNQYGTILFRNLPTDPALPFTPKDGDFQLKKTRS